jgi:hypothetical protein
MVGCSASAEEFVRGHRLSFCIQTTEECSAFSE